MMNQVIEWLNRFDTIVSLLTLLFISVYALRAGLRYRRGIFLDSVQVTVNHLWQEKLGDAPVTKFVTRAVGQPSVKEAFENGLLSGAVITAIKRLHGSSSIIALPADLQEKVTSILIQWVGSIYATEFIDAALRGGKPEEEMAYIFLTYERPIAGEKMVTRLRLQIVPEKDFIISLAGNVRLQPMMDTPTTRARVRTLSELFTHVTGLSKVDPIRPLSDGRIPVIARIWLPVKHQA